MKRARNSIVWGSLALLAACGTQEPAPKPAQEAPPKPAATAASRPAQAPAQQSQSLPDGAYRVEWAEVTLPASLGAGEAVSIQVGLKNTSPVTWPSGVGTAGRLYTVRMVHRWLKVVPHGDPQEAVAYSARWEVPPLGPGESASVEGVVTAPAKRGRYLVEFELVHEGVAAFSKKGAPTKRVEVKVR